MDVIGGGLDRSSGRILDQFGTDGTYRGLLEEILMMSVSKSKGMVKMAIVEIEKNSIYSN